MGGCGICSRDIGRFGGRNDNLKGSVTLEKSASSVVLSSREVLKCRL